jgi:glycosyltransferase involved in cell wall biosynthesis
MILYEVNVSLFMKRVFLKGRSQGGLSHSLYRELLINPPEGYRIFAGKAEFTGRQQLGYGLNKRQQLIYNFDKKLQRYSYMRDAWHRAKTLIYMGIKRTQSPRLPPDSNPDLVYASQQLIFAKLPWVVDFEYANALADYGDIRLVRRLVQKQLGSKYCKKILPWSNWAKRTLYRSLDCGSFKEKVETVHLAVSKKDFAKKEKDDKLRLLFVGSINQFNFLNFEWKGGFEVVEAFLELSKKYDCLELVIRSWVPPEIIERCAGKPNIKIINQVLSEGALADIYASSDIFLFPSHMNLGMAILEAMSYGLAVIAIDLYDTPEAVQNMKTGILIDRPSNVPYYIWNGAPNHYDKDLLPRIRQFRRWIVNEIVHKASLLIEESSLRRQIGREARRLTEQGEFSITKRNEKLKRIFDEATCAG